MGGCVLTTSGTQNFQPSIGELTLYAFGLCGIRRTEITQQHLTDVRMAANLMLADWNNSTPNLWRVSEVIVDLVEGQATYPVDPSCIMILDAFIRINDGTAGQFDRAVWPISRTEYAYLPNKEFQAPPTVFWFDRLLSPTVTLWQVPPATGVAQFHYYQVSQIFDANMPNGETPDIPTWWFRAFAYGMADQLFDSYPSPDAARSARIEARAVKYLEDARTQNVENVPLYIGPALSGYYQR